MPTVARLVVAILGIATIIVGLRAAWGSGSGAAALVVGAVLVVLALLFHPDLEQLGFKYGGAEVTYRRAQRRAELLSISEALEAVSKPAENADVDAQLATLLTEIESLAKRLEQRAEEEEPEPMSPSGRPAERHLEDWQSRWAHVWSRQGIERSATEPFGPEYYALQHPIGGTTPEIYVARTGWLHDWRIKCSVVNPDGRAASRVFFGDAHMGTLNFRVTYPHDFPSASALVPGEYEFRWSRVGQTGRQAQVVVDRLTVDEDALQRREGAVRLEPQREVRTS